MRRMAVEPSPTAEATRFIAPCRTSPAANTPGVVVSSRKGARCRGPVLTGAGSGEDESPLVALYRFGEPAGERLCADQDEQAGGRCPFGLARVAVAEQQLLKVPAATAARDLAAVADVHVGRGVDLADQVVGHARRQGLRADENRDLPRVFRQMQRGLPG